MRLKKLLKHGYFPIQLPPYFNTLNFSKKINVISREWEAMTQQPLTKGEKYSVARSSYYRRMTAILNPIGYYYLAFEIDKYWSKIEKHYRKSSISLSKPKIITNNNSLRAIEISKFNELYEAKVKLSSGYQYALITDISSYFSTIYTHSISWALHTKKIAKKNKRNKSDDFFGNILDDKSMSVQDGQTVGIPIGPDTSHIISEIIGSTIDKEFFDSLGDKVSGFRYVDDYFLFFNSREDAERALSILTKIISNYELQINASKTKIVEIRDFIEDSWRFKIKRIVFSDDRKKQKDAIHDFFETVFGLVKEYQDESIVKYALKKISSIIIKKSNWSIFESYLLRCGYGFPNTLQVITSILCTYQHHNYDIDKKNIYRFCNNLIKIHAIADHHGEVSWLLSLCKEMKIEIKRDVIREIEAMSSSVCKLIVLDLYFSKIIKHNFISETLRQYSKKEELYTSNWLLAYEAGKRNWLVNDNYDYLKEEPYFNVLLENNVSFYDQSVRIKPLFERKKDIDFPKTKYDIFDGDKEISAYFEFDEVDDEYFDSLPENGEVNDEYEDEDEDDLTKDY